MANKKHLLGTNSSRRVLVLDADSRPALALVRTFGEQQWEVACSGHTALPLAAASRYSRILFRLPDPRKAPEQYIQDLLALISRWKPQLLLPVSNVTLTICLEHRTAIEKWTKLPFADKEVIFAATNKLELLERAKGLGIETPRTLLVPSIAERTSADVQNIKSFRFPAVLKTQKTDSSLDKRYERRPVYYPNTADEALGLVSVSSLGPNSRVPFLLQEQIWGPGVGVFALCWQGQTGAIFCHRRILEYPPTGGVSALSESIPESEAPVAAACRLLESLHWSGIAMVEFKQTENEFCLMEVNAHFWGSLELSIQSDRNFPLLLAELYLSENPAQTLANIRERLEPYPAGRRLRWKLGTLKHSWQLLRKNPFATAANIIFKNSLELLSGTETIYDVYRKDDPKPLLYEFLGLFSKK